MDFRDLRSSAVTREGCIDDVSQRRPREKDAEGTENAGHVYDDGVSHLGARLRLARMGGEKSERVVDQFRRVVRGVGAIGIRT